MALAGLGLDFATKQLAVAYLDPYHPPSLFGGLITLQLIRNSGAAFSLGENYTIVFTVLASLALLFVLIVLFRRIRHLGWAVALGLLTAGVAGNLVDRVFRPPTLFHGHVVDFIQLPHYAIFNVADMCVTCAAALIIILAIFKNVALSGERHPVGKSASATPAVAPGGPEAADHRRPGQAAADQLDDQDGFDQDQDGADNHGADQDRADQDRADQDRADQDREAR